MMKLGKSKIKSRAKGIRTPKGAIADGQKGLDKETPVWKEPPFIFGLLLFPAIFLLTVILYFIHITFLVR